MQIHFAIGGVEKREFAGKTFAEEKAGDFARLIGLRQSQAREFEAGGGDDLAGVVASGAPALEQFAAKGRLGAGTANLFTTMMSAASSMAIFCSCKRLP